MDNVCRPVESEPLFCSKVLAYKFSIKHNHNQVLSSGLRTKTLNRKTPNQTKTKTIYLKAGKLAIPAFLIAYIWIAIIILDKALRVTWLCWPVYVVLLLGRFSWLPVFRFMPM